MVVNLGCVVDEAAVVVTVVVAPAVRLMTLLVSGKISVDGMFVEVIDIIG